MWYVRRESQGASLEKKERKTEKPKVSSEQGGQIKKDHETTGDGQNNGAPSDRAADMATF